MTTMILTNAVRVGSTLIPAGTAYDSVTQAAEISAAEASGGGFSESTPSMDAAAANALALHVAGVSPTSIGSISLANAIGAAPSLPVLAENPVSPVEGSQWIKSVPYVPFAYPTLIEGATTDIIPGTTADRLRVSIAVDGQTDCDLFGTGPGAYSLYIRPSWGTASPDGPCVARSPQLLASCIFGRDTSMTGLTGAFVVSAEVATSSDYSCFYGMGISSLSIGFVNDSSTVVTIDNSENHLTVHYKTGVSTFGDVITALNVWGAANLSTAPETIASLTVPADSTVVISHTSDMDLYSDRTTGGAFTCVNVFCLNDQSTTYAEIVTALNTWSQANLSTPSDIAELDDPVVDGPIACTTFYFTCTDNGQLEVQASMELYSRADGTTWKASLSPS